MNKYDYIQLFYDRGFTPPYYFVPFPAPGNDTYCRMNGKGGWDFVRNGEGADFFRYGRSSSPRLKKEKRKQQKEALEKQRERLLRDQAQIIEFLKTTLEVPFQLRFIDVLSAVILEGEHSRRKKRGYERAFFFLMCVAGSLLITEFGGAFTLKGSYIVVELSRVKVTVHLARKLYGKTNHNFNQWYYELCTQLWFHIRKGHKLELTQLDCIELRQDYSL